MAITPFPISAHRTGGPDFRSPALRLASPQGTRRGSEWQAFEAQQTEFPIDSVVREPAGGAPLPFLPEFGGGAVRRRCFAVQNWEYCTGRPRAKRWCADGRRAVLGGVHLP